MSIIIEINGKYLESKYSIYVIEIINNNDNYYYIGQTGDAHYITARSPFRRLNGHLSDLKSSTENQIYKYFAMQLIENNESNSKSYSSEEKELIENFFVNSLIKMYSFPLIDFKYNSSIETHKNKRKQVVEFEKQLIHLFKNSNRNLINKKIPSKVSNIIQFVEEYNEIKKIFKL